MAMNTILVGLFFVSFDHHAHVTSVYSVTPDSTLAYTVQKLIASKPVHVRFSQELTGLIEANSHRLFVTDPLPGNTSPMSAALDNLCGVVSIVDSEHIAPLLSCTCLSIAVLALLARAANVPGVDPLEAQTRRRMSTSSSRSSSSRSSSLSSTRVRVNSSGLGPFAPTIPIPVARPRSTSRGPNVAHSPGSLRGASASPRVSFVVEGT
jgi:hypothetical protein